MNNIEIALPVPVIDVKGKCCRIFLQVIKCKHSTKSTKKLLLIFRETRPTDKLYLR